METFRWISAGSAIPAHNDLRAHGWSMAAPADSDYILIAHVSALHDPATRAGAADSRPGDFWRALRGQTIVSGVNHPAERARLIAAGFGDAVSDATTSAELDARAKRLSRLSQMLPPQRVVGPLVIDLLSRDAYYLAKSIGLFPMEFALLWRLAETPGDPVSREALIAAVWPTNQMPSPNAKAVQMSRLRAKLATAGLGGMIETVSGGYLLQTVSQE